MNLPQESWLHLRTTLYTKYPRTSARLTSGQSYLRDYTPFLFLSPPLFFSLYNSAHICDILEDRCKCACTCVSFVLGIKNLTVIKVTKPCDFKMDWAFFSNYIGLKGCRQEVFWGFPYR